MTDTEALVAEHLVGIMERTWRNREPILDLEEGIYFRTCGFYGKSEFSKKDNSNAGERLEMKDGICWGNRGARLP